MRCINRIYIFYIIAEKLARYNDQNLVSVIDVQTIRSVCRHRFAGKIARAIKAELCEAKFKMNNDDASKIKWLTF